MAQQIGFNELFNKASFDQGVSELVKVIGKITEEIELAELAGRMLSETLGRKVKEEIKSLSAASKTLTKDIADITAKMDKFKATTVQIDATTQQYKKEVDKLTTELNKLKKAQEQVNNETVKTGNTTSQAKKNFANLSQSLLGVAAGAALVHRGVTILVDQFKMAVQASIQFEQTMMEVRAVTGATSNELELLAENANRLGASTEKTSIQVANLQKELGKLGFSSTDILASTNAIVDLSTATGEDLVKSGEVAAATLRAFNLETTEMTRVVDVMVGSFNRSALDLEKFRESMKLIAPIAASTGVELEVMTASISKLADTGISGSLSGTALRNLLSSMADPTEKLVKFMGSLNSELADGIKTSDDFVLALKTLKASNLDLATAVQMVDVRARSAFFTLVEQADSIEGLTLEYQDLEGEAKRVAYMMRDTLSNDINIANSAFDALRRNIIESFTPAMREGTQGVTLLAEAFRYLVDDVREGGEELSDFDKTFVEWITGAAQAKLLFSGLVDVIKEYVKVSKLQEAGETINKQAQVVAETLTTAQKELGVYTKLKESFDKGMPVKDLVGSLKFLGAEYDFLREKITVHGEDEEKVAKRVFVALERNLKSRKGTLEQLESTVKSSEAELRVIEELERKNGKITEADATRAAILRSEIDSSKQILKNFSVLESKLSSMFDLTKGQKQNYADINKETAKFSDLTQLELKLLEEKNKANLVALEGDLKILKEKGDNVAGIFLLEQEIVKKKLDLALIAYQEEMRLIELSKDGVEQNLRKKEIAWEKYYSKISSLEQEVTLDRLKQANSTEEKAKKSQEDAFERSMKFAIELWKNRNKLNEEGQKNEKKSEEEKWDEMIQTAERAAEGLALVSRAIFDNRQIARDNELNAIDSWEKERIRLAGDNDEAIAAIEREAEERRRKVAIQQAKDNKKEAMFQIILSTAVAVMRTLEKGAGFFSTPLAVATAAFGAAQLAVVANRPLPQFEKGTNYSPEGRAIVGEAGSELIIDGRTKQARLSPDRASITHLSKGSQVIPAHITQKLLTDPSFDYNGVAEKYLNKSTVIKVEQEKNDFDMLAKRVEQAITNIPINQTNFDERGVTNYVVKRNVRLRRLNKRY